MNAETRLQIESKMWRHAGLQVLRPCEPVVRYGACGWLAVTPAGYPYRIGVQGDTEDEARLRFDAALIAWDELAQRRRDKAGSR